MFKKLTQTSNGGPPTSHKTTNISPSPLTAVYLMEIKPTISDWHELLHNSCSAVDLESILRFYFRSILMTLANTVSISSIKINKRLDGVLGI